MTYKHNPRIISKPGEHLEVEVEVSDNAAPDEIFDAMLEAAKLAGLDK